MSKIEIRSGFPFIIFQDGICRPCGHAEYEIIKQLQQNRVELLQQYTQFLYSHGYIDDDCFMEKPSPIHEFLNKEK